MDIPILGRGDLGLRHDVARQMKDWVTELLTDILSDERSHAEATAAGAFHWREVFVRNLGAGFQKSRSECDHLANVTYRFLEVEWQRRHPGVPPKLWLDKVTIVPETTPEEIDAAWEVEIGSSAPALHQFWDGESRTRKGAGALGARVAPRKDDD